MDLPLSWDHIPPPMKMKKLMNYIPGLGLGKRHQGTHKVIEVKEHTTRRGLGYVPTPEDVKEDRRISREKLLAIDKRIPYITSHLRPYSLDIARYFIKKTNDLNGGTERKEEIINARQDWSVTTDKWEKLQQSLRKLRGLEPNPVRRAFLDIPILPGPTTTTIHNEYRFEENPSLVEEFGKLSVIEPFINKLDESVLELVMPRASREDFREDVWDGPLLQQLFSEETEMPDLIDFVFDNSMIVVVGESGMKPFDPPTLVNQSKMPLRNWVTVDTHSEPIVADLYHSKSRLWFQSRNPPFRHVLLCFN